MHKNFILVSSFSLICGAAGAQFQKGDKLLGGSFNASVSKNENVNVSQQSKYRNVSVAPSLQWFVNPRQVAGVNLLYNNSYQKEEFALNNEVRRNTDNSYGAGVFTQRFFGLTKNLYFTLTSSAGAAIITGNRKITSTGTPAEFKTNGFSINAGLAPGISYQLSPRWLVDASLNNFVAANYSRSVSKQLNTASENKSTQESFGVSSSLTSNILGNTGIGFRWLLKK